MSNFNPATIWPSQILESYKKLGDDMFVVNWDKPKIYGDSHKVKTFGKLVKIINDKGETELRPVSMEVVNVPTDGWVPGSFDDTSALKDKKSSKKSSNKSSKKSDDDSDGDYNPKLPFVRSTTFERPDENGKMVTEPLGEACWILRKGFVKAIEAQIKLTKGDKDKYGGFWNGPRKAMEPFKLYRKFNKEAGDKKKDIVEIDDEDMIAYEDPIFKVNIDVNKKTNYVSAYIVDVSKIRRKGKEFTAPEAEYQHDKLTKQTVGKFISKGSLCSGIFTFDTIKSHSFGISQPFEIGWKKLNEDEKGKRVLYVKRRAASGLATKMNKEQTMMAMLAGQVPEGSDDEESDDADVKKKRDAAKKAALKEMNDDDEDSTESADKSEESESGKKNKNKNKNKVSDDSEDSDQGSSGKNDSDDEGSEESGKKSKNNKNKKKDDSDDEEPEKSDSSNKKSKKNKNKKKDDSDNEESEESEDEDSGKKSKSKNNNKNKNKKNKDDSDDDKSEESEDEDSGKKSKNNKNKKKDDSDNEKSEKSSKKSSKKDKGKKNKKQVDSDAEDEIDGIETDSE